MFVHPKARAVISKLSLPSPIRKYFTNEKWEIDLSNNTNPFVQEFSSYPDVKQQDLKNLYLSRIKHLSHYPHIKNGDLGDITSENVLFTVGSLEGIDILIRTFCEPDQDKICLIQPTFSAYEHWGLIHNLEITEIPLEGDEYTTFDIEKVINDKPKMVFICNPNNPIGTCLQPDLIEELCEAFDGIVVVDEAYIEFSEQRSALYLLHKYKNLIVLRTFSKAWGLAGVRCGIILADELIIHTLRYVQLPFSFSSPTQAIIRHRLLYSEEIVASWEKIKKLRKNLTDALAGLKIIEKVFRSETNFLLVIVKDFKRVMEVLNEHKIYVQDFSAVLPNAIRVSIGTKEQNKKFIEAILKA